MGETVDAKGGGGESVPVFCSLISATKGPRGAGVIPILAQLMNP